MINKHSLILVASSLTQYWASPDIKKASFLINYETNLTDTKKQGNKHILLTKKRPMRTIILSKETTQGKWHA